MGRMGSRGRYRKPNWRISVSTLLGTEGKGFALAQARLRLGHVHHCMRTVSQCALALDMMCWYRHRTTTAFTDCTRGWTIWPRLKIGSPGIPCAVKARVAASARPGAGFHKISTGPTRRRKKPARNRQG